MGGTTRMNFLNLDDKELDQHIYRIMPQEYVFTLFSDSQNVLSKISNWKVPIPMKPPPCSEMIAPPDSGTISPPVSRGLQAVIVVSSFE